MKKSELYNVKSAEFNELIDSAKVDLTTNDIHYKKLKNEVKNLKEKHPNLQLFFEDEGVIELCKDDCKVLQKVLDLYQEMHMYEEEKIIFEEKVRRAGLSKSEFFRKIILNYKLKEQPDERLCNREC